MHLHASQEGGTALHAVAMYFLRDDDSPVEVVRALLADPRVDVNARTWVRWNGDSTVHFLLYLMLIAYTRAMCF
jgi:hypothetical protein